MGHGKKAQGHSPAARSSGSPTIAVLLWNLQHLTIRKKAQKESQIYINLWKNTNTALTKLFYRCLVTFVHVNSNLVLLTKGISYRAVLAFRRVSTVEHQF